MKDSLPNHSSSTEIRSIFTSLLLELPSNTQIWKTLCGKSLNAEDLLKEIEENTEIGNQYISEVLRVSRDLITRKNKNLNKPL